jgi:hypothetical protein
MQVPFGSAQGRLSTTFVAKSAPNSAQDDTTNNLNGINIAFECHFIRNSVQASQAVQDDSTFYLTNSGVAA